MNQAIIQRAFDGGHSIGKKISNAATIEKLDSLSKEIDAYASFMDENFGIVDDYDEKECELTAFLYVALDWKRKSLYPEDANNYTVHRLFQGYMQDYFDYLDSMIWTTESFGIKLR